MEILLIEDKDDKIESIRDFIYETIPKDECEIIEAKSLREARKEIFGGYFDLIIFDVFLPLSAGDTIEEDISEEIIRDFSDSRNYQTETIVITGYDYESIDNVDLFNEKGVTVVCYQEDERWKESLRLKISRAKTKIKYDFLIFCALEKERSAYSKTDAILGELKVLNGINCQCIEIENKKGLCITPSNMGLVNMAITATKAIEAFQPKIVAMSGICAGVEGEVNLLDLIVGDVCWEYQTGKYKDNEFKQEPYQSKIQHEIKTEIEQFILNDDNAEKIKEGLYETELKKSKIIIAPISSGSAVIASAERMKKIGLQHRKMAGLEMEMYSLYEAASQSLSKPDFFGAKVVVDLGNSSKGDDFQTTASIISARFVVNFLSKMFN